MKTFLGDDFLLESDVAMDLYHRVAKDLPIVDYHCHLSPQQMASDHRFRFITEILLEGDHYKWRAMRTNGEAERFCTGDASDREKFEAWARTVPHTLRNPLYHWTAMELKRPFGVTKLLSPAPARSGDPGLPHLAAGQGAGGGGSGGVQRVGRQARAGLGPGGLELVLLPGGAGRPARRLPRARLPGLRPRPRAPLRGALGGCRGGRVLRPAARGEGHGARGGPALQVGVAATTGPAGPRPRVGAAVPPGGPAQQQHPPAPLPRPGHGLRLDRRLRAGAAPRALPGPPGRDEPARQDHPLQHESRGQRAPGHHVRQLHGRLGAGKDAVRHRLVVPGPEGRHGGADAGPFEHGPALPLRGHGDRLAQLPLLLAPRVLPAAALQPPGRGRTPRAPAGRPRGPRAAGARRGLRQCPRLLRLPPGTSGRGGLTRQGFGIVAGAGLLSALVRAQGPPELRVSARKAARIPALVELTAEPAARVYGRTLQESKFPPVRGLTPPGWGA